MKIVHAVWAWLRQIHQVNCTKSASEWQETLGFEETPRRVPEKLHFTRLPEPKGRQGFVEERQHRELAAKCEETYMRAMLALVYNFGFRKAELLTLQVSAVEQHATIQ